MSPSFKTVIESVGAYLPPREVTTAEIVQGCERELNMPLERLTGIRSRRRAGDSEFAIDLAEKAVRDCLSRSTFAPSEIDVIVSTNISRWDAKNQVFFEPPTSCRLKRRLGLPAHTLAIDISNACAGMWTGVYLVDSLIRSGEVRCGIVVSGEYITHLIDTAQKEVRSFMDSQLASLTLGDAGAAVTLARGTSEAHGLVDFDLYTLSKFSRFCIAKPTAEAHGGASMITDAIRVTEAVIPHAAKHARLILQRNQWGHEHIKHIIPHQTSELTMKAGIREIRRLLEHDYSDRLINNLKHRGNTSSNAHFLALHDAIQDQTINSGDSLVFCISGSGQSTGTALYVMDDLPERMRSSQSPSRDQDVGDAFVMPVQLEIESMAVVDYPGQDEPDTIELIRQAAEACLEKSAHDRKSIDLLIAACTYRSEFLMEPAIAALAAGAIGMNDEREPEDAHKTFAFDVTCGEVGYLKSIYLAGEMVRSGRGHRMMVAASEVENNIERCPEQLLGIRPMSAAMILQEATGESGFTCFGFTDFVDHVGLREVHAGWHDNGRRVYLTVNDDGNLWPILLDCLVDGTRQFLEKNAIPLSDIQWVLPTQHESAWMESFCQRLGVDSRRMLDLKPNDRGNPMSVSFPMALAEGKASGQLKSGDLILIASVSPGVQVGCSLYRV